MNWNADIMAVVVKVTRRKAGSIMSGVVEIASSRFVMLVIVKVQPQQLKSISQGAVNMGVQNKSSRSCQGAFRKIVQAKGLKGLWKCVLPNVQRAFLVNMGELAGYDHAEELVFRSKIAYNNVYAPTLASMIISILGNYAAAANGYLDIT
nr:mitochondrial uncoupling protein 3-like [Arachis hypogaea]